MNPVPPFTMTPMLRAAAELRIEEFESAKSSFIQRYRLDQKCNSRADILETISKLLEEINLNNSDLQNDDHDFDIENLTRFVSLAKDDLSISDQKLLTFRDQVRDGLDKRLNRMDVASLHISLMRESMNVAHSNNPAIAANHNATSYDDFELVESEREDVMEQFESDAFTAKPVDATSIETFLSSLFEDKVDSHALEQLRRDMNSYGAELMAEGLETDQDSLMWTIVDLLKNNLVDPDKKKVLEDYLQSPIALRELVATLNMKTYRQWNFRSAHDGLPTVARRNDDGQYCVVVEEDLIDMLFLHGTAMGWASKLKECLKQLVSRLTYFNGQLCTPQENCKEKYYLHRHGAIKRISRYTVCKMCEPTLVPPPPLPMPPMSPPPPPPNIYCASEYSPRHSYPPPPPPPPPPIFNTILDVERQNVYKAKFFLSQLPEQEGCLPKDPCYKSVQAEMIKVLAAEAKLRHAFDGSVHSLTARISNLASSLPHKSVLTVLKFLGVPESFLSFFDRVLSVPLKKASPLPGQAGNVLNRACGVTPGHRLGIFFSEAVVSFLDLSFHEATGVYLYRIHEQLNFVGTLDQQRLAVKEIEQFASVMGLSLDHCQGSRELKIGLLALNDGTGMMHVEMPKVVQYAYRTKEQLDTCDTVLEWIRVWNDTIGSYIAHLFGPLAEGLGRTHLDAVKAAYKIIYSIIFDGGDLTTRVKHMLVGHTLRTGNVTKDAINMLEAIMYMPQAYGGLGIKNPFITLQLADEIMENPSSAIEDYLDEERVYYEHAAKIFTSISTELRQQKLDDIFHDHKECIIATFGPDCDLSVFPTLAEVTARRERTTYPNLAYNSVHPPPLPYKTPSLVKLWRSLLNEPVHRIEPGAKVSGHMHLYSEFDRTSWRQLSGEDQWVLQMYSEECFDKFGSLDIWWADGVPTEVYKALRGHVWDEGDDDDTVTENITY